MLFNSLDYLIFLPVVVCMYYLIPDRVKYLWLLAASYYFYMCWNVRYVLLLLFSTGVTYIGGLLLEKVKAAKTRNTDGNVRCRKAVVLACLLLNLGVLFYFKYSRYAALMLGKLFGNDMIGGGSPGAGLLLPVGISFYTFQSLGYLIDVYRGEIYAERNFFRYALFVSFFPQLVAGPIERSKSLLRQLGKPVKFEYERARDGVLLILYGLFLKVVLADRISMFVDTVYGDSRRYAGCYLAVATILFAVQIYCDFYGYSVIAVGSAQILGIRLMENFDTPYLSGSVAGFWRRWHISLTSWLRDYLYIPLGGSRRGKLRKYGNKMLVFLASGIWHGAGLSYVVWGGLNGFYQVAGEALEPFRKKACSLLHLNCGSLAHRFLRTGFTFLLVDFSWIFFRAGGFRKALGILANLFGVWNPWVLFDDSIYQCGLDRKNFWLMLLCIGILLFADICKRKGISVRKVVMKQDFWFRCLFFVFAVCAILVFGVWGPGYREASFLYFQF